MVSKFEGPDLFFSCVELLHFKHEELPIIVATALAAKATTYIPAQFQNPKTYQELCEDLHQRGIIIEPVILHVILNLDVADIPNTCIQRNLNINPLIISNRMPKCATLKSFRFWRIFMCRVTNHF